MLPKDVSPEWDSATPHWGQVFAQGLVYTLPLISGRMRRVGFSPVGEVGARRPVYSSTVENAH